MAMLGGGDGKAGAESKKRKRVEYIYGNYIHYYGYRVGRSLEDPRVSVFKEEWVRGKDCLDIGCNEGHVTIAVAVKFGCKSMLGVDIDSKLVYKARKNLRLELEALQCGSLENGKSEDGLTKGGQGSARETTGSLSRVQEDEAGFAPSRDADAAADKPVDDPGPENAVSNLVEEEKVGLAAVCNGDDVAERPILDPGREKAVNGVGENGISQENAQGNQAVLTIEEHKSLLGRITFRTQNYLEVPARSGSYDTIFCLSVSKWIHLNWGDTGLINFFAKIFKELRQGGVLILEPQPWKSYAKKRKISEVFRRDQLRVAKRQRRLQEATVRLLQVKQPEKNRRLQAGNASRQELGDRFSLLDAPMGPLPRRLTQNRQSSTQRSNTMYEWESEHNQFGCIGGRCNTLIQDEQVAAEVEELFVSGSCYCWIDLNCFSATKHLAGLQKLAKVNGSYKTSTTTLRGLSTRKEQQVKLG